LELGEPLPQRAILSAAANSIVITDPLGNVIWSNPAFSQLTGYPALEIAGRNMRLLRSGQHDGAVYAQLWQTILAGRIWRGELINRHRNGSYFRHTQTITPLRDGRGCIGSFIAIQQDGRARARGQWLKVPSRPEAKWLDTAQHQQAVEAERTRVAQDMHDELGGNLTQIKLLSERLERDARQPHKVVGYAQFIAQVARELAKSIDEIVWAVDPRRDRLEDLGSYLVAYAEEFLAVTNLRLRLDIPEELPALQLSSQVRRSLLLALKESLNNVVRHARASEVHLGLSVAGGQLELRVTDNGSGITGGRLLSGGNGLANLRQRLAEIGGECYIESLPGSGTTVRMKAGIANRY
jgi:PAS domain S-box-containing protein